MKAPQTRLQLRDFRLIRAIRDSGQLGLAAERLALTQPAASRLLARIEAVVGQPLFLRHPKGMLATPSGEALARNADELLNGIDRSLLELAALGAGRTGRVKVGAVTGGAVALLVPAIRRLKEHANGADIHIEVAPSDTLVDGLINAEFDFIMARVPAGVDPRQFAIVPGRPEHIRFIARAGHPLATRRGIRLAELARFDLVIQAPNTPLRHAVEAAFQNEAAALPEEIVNTSSLLATIAYLAGSDAVAPVSLEVADLLGPPGLGADIRPLDTATPIGLAAYHLITRRNQLVSPLAMRLHQLLISAMAGD